ASLSLHPLAVELFGLFERMLVDRQRRVQPVLVGGDAHERLRDQLTRVRPAPFHRRAHLRDGRFDDGHGKGRRPLRLAVGGERERGRGERCDGKRACHTAVSYDTRRGITCVGPISSNLYSALSAIIGSTRVARRAGTIVAINETIVTIANTDA